MQSGYKNISVRNGEGYAYVTGVVFMSQELIQNIVLASLAPAVLQWKDLQSERCVQVKQLHFAFLVPIFHFFLLSFNFICLHILNEGTTMCLKIN